MVVNGFLSSDEDPRAQRTMYWQAALTALPFPITTDVEDVLTNVTVKFVTAAIAAGLTYYFLSGQFGSTHGIGRYCLFAE